MLFPGCFYYVNMNQRVFSFTLLTAERDPFWKSARKYCIFRVEQIQETGVLYVDDNKKVCSYENRF